MQVYIKPKDQYYAKKKQAVEEIVGQKEEINSKNQSKLLLIKIILVNWLMKSKIRTTIPNSNHNSTNS